MVTVPNTEKILAANIVDQTEDTCKVEIKLVSENEALLTFYCLEPGQGATINVYHTNMEEEETRLGGRVKGGKIVNRTFEMVVENGELIISTGKHKLYFDKGGLGIRFDLLKTISEICGIKRNNRDKKKK